MQRYALRIRGKSCEAEYFPEVEGFFVGWVEGGLTQPDQHNLVKSLAQGAAYAFAGAMGTAANILDHSPLEFDPSLLLQKILPPEIRLNFLAEYLYGNTKHIMLKEPVEPKNILDIKFNTSLWGLPRQDPREIYAGPAFYAHPAGIKYDRRWYSLPYLSISQGVVLEAEPHNPHDPNAVRLWTNAGIDLGYLPRAIAATVAFHLRRGKQYKGKVALVRANDELFYRQLAVKIVTE